MEVEGSLVTPAAGEDLADGCGLVAAFLEDAGCCCEDHLPGPDRPFLLDHVGLSPFVVEPGDRRPNKKPPSLYITGGWLRVHAVRLYDIQ